MATYKKGFKKENPETVLLKVIIGIIIVVFLLVGVLFVYDATQGASPAYSNGTNWKSVINGANV